MNDLKKEYLKWKEEKEKENERILYYVKKRRLQLRHKRKECRYMQFGVKRWQLKKIEKIERALGKVDGMEIEINNIEENLLKDTSLQSFIDSKE